MFGGCVELVVYLRSGCVKLYLKCPVAIVFGDLWILVDHGPIISLELAYIRPLRYFDFYRALEMGFCVLK